MSNVNDYLFFLQEEEDFEVACRKKHEALKQKDSLMYRHQVMNCQMWAINQKIKPYEKKISDLKQKYCKEDEIKKRTGRKILGPFAVRSCWKERDEKIDQLRKKYEMLRKKYLDLNKESKSIWKKIVDRRKAQGK
jgi:hypothetical protein